MKIFPGTNPPIPPRHLRKKRRTEVPANEVHQVVHSLLNQFSVINLCSFKLIASCGNDVTRASRMIWKCSSGPFKVRRLSPNSYPKRSRNRRRSSSQRDHD
jgi:hypothetical protein